MVVLNSPELIKALASWVAQQRNPYARPGGEPRQTVKLMSSSPDVWLEINRVESGLMEVSCIHIIHTSAADYQLADLRREFRQFNVLMEKVRLPVIVWEDKAKKEFQLRWQEVLNTHADLEYVHHLLEQSLYLANALQSRLGWTLSTGAQPVFH